MVQNFLRFAATPPEPDIQLGFIALDWLTMGQLLSIPMLIGGLVLYYKSCHDAPNTSKANGHLP